MSDGLHVGNRVRIHSTGGIVDGYTGTIGGVAWAHIVTSFIVVLDVPVPVVPGPAWSAVALTPGNLERIE